MMFQTTDSGGPRGQLGPRNSAHQHSVSEGSTHTRLRQRMESPNRLQTVSGRQTRLTCDSWSFTVDNGLVLAFHQVIDL